jgi:hypothetical protein
MGRNTHVAGVFCRLAGVLGVTPNLFALISVFLGELALPLGDVTLFLRGVALLLGHIALLLRDVSLLLREVALLLGHIALRGWIVRAGGFGGVGCHKLS